MTEAQTRGSPSLYTHARGLQRERCALCSESRLELEMQFIMLALEEVSDSKLTMRQLQKCNR